MLIATDDRFYGATWVKLLARTQFKVPYEQLIINFSCNRFNDNFIDRFEIFEAKYKYNRISLHSTENLTLELNFDYSVNPKQNFYHYDKQFWNCSHLGCHFQTKALCKKCWNYYCLRHYNKKQLLCTNCNNTELLLILTA